jgi:Aspartate/tyrosine/aromatic aminotransferase
MKSLSKKVEQLAPSGIRAFFDLALGMKDIISLGVGEPDFVTPWNIREKVIYSLEQGYTSYTSNKGLLELRQAISQFLKHRHGLSYDPEDEILITVGVSEALDLAVRALLNTGDGVLVPEPSYVSYHAVSFLAGGKPVYLNTSEENGFKITASQLNKNIKKNTKVLMLNYPSNPTGATYTKKELDEIAKVVARRNLLVISDEVYDELTYDFKHTAFPSLKGMQKNTVYLNGFSKTYAMTGFRLGYACGPKEIIAAMTKIHQYTMLCASIVSQMGALEALKGGFKSLEEMKREYRRRRDFLVDGLNNLGFWNAFKPQGAFYVFPSVKNTGLSSLEFAEKLLKAAKGCAGARALRLARPGKTI